MAKKTTTKAAKPEVIDTRKTGPLGYKALLLANLAGFSASPEAMDYALNNTDFSYMPQYQSSIEATQDREYTPEELNIGEDIGSSMFDPESYNLYELQNYKDIRAENQPWYALAAAGITKGAILAGTTFVDGTLGLLDGVYTAINEGRWSGIWDNPVTQAMAKINEVAEEELPNYYTQFQQENPWSADSLFSANTVFDKFVKNLGFMVGAAYSGGLYTKGLSIAAKYIGAIKGLASAAETLGASSKTEAVFKGLGQALKGGQERKVARQLMAKGALAMESSNATRATKSVIGSFFNAQAEGTIEAVSNSNDWAKKQKQRIDDNYLAELSKAQEEYQFDGDYAKLMATVDNLNKGRDAAYNKIEEDRTKMGNADLLFNLPILWVGDIATFGKLYAGGWRAARNEAQTVTKATKQALADAKAAVKAGDKDALKRLNEIVQRAEKTGYRGLSAEEKALVEEVQNSYAGGKLGAYGRAILKGPIKEGNEEMAQGAAAEASGLYYQDDVDNIYNAQVHPEAKQKVLNWMSSIGQGISNTYGNPNKWEEGLIGAITGVLGSPTIGRKTNSKDQTWLGRGKLVGMSGGLFTEIRDQLKDLEGAERTAAHITKTLKDPNFQNRFKHLVAQTHFNDMMEKAVAENSELDFKDAETAAAFEDIMYFKKGNRLDLLKSALANTELFEQEDIDQIVEMTQKQYSAINASINEDLKQVETLANQLATANKDYETKFGEEAYGKAFQAFLDAGGGSNTMAVQRYDAFIDAMNEAEENIKNLQALLDNYLDRINNSTNIIQSPYIKVSGDETTMMSADEIKEDIQKRAKKINQIIDDISEAQDEIDNTTGGAYTDEQLTTLTWYKVRMKDWERRAAAMSGNLKSFIDTALKNPKFALSIEDIEDLLSYADELGLSAELRALYGGNIRATKAFLKAGLTIKDTLLNLTSTLSTDSESGTGNSRYGIVLAKYLASDKEIELEKEDGSKIKMPLGKYLLEAIGSFIDADLTYTNDQKEPIKKMILDLEKIGEAYSKYDKLLDEYKKNPEKIDQAHARTDAANETHITNKAAKTIAERFNWDASIGEIARLLDENEADINNMGGMDKFMNSLNDAQKSKIKLALKLNDAVISLNEVVDESDMDENLKNIAKDLIDKESKEANTVAELASALNDALNEGIIKEMADALLDEDVDERVKDDLLTKAEEQLAELFNTSLSDIAASLDRKEKQQEADRKRQEKIEKEIKEQAEKGELPKEETKEDLPQDLTPPVEQDLTPPDDKDLTPPTEPNNDIVIQNGRTKKEAWKPTDNQKLSGGIELGKKGYGNRPQISEYYLHAVDGMNPVEYYTAHPDKIPAGVDKDAFIKYTTAVHKFLKARGAFNYVSHQLKPNDEITFELNVELSKDAGVPVVVMKVGDQVIGTIKSQLDFDAYNEAVKKDPNRKDPTVEAQRALYDTIVNQNVPTVKTKVKSLMGGTLPISSKENTVSEIFGKNTPIIGWVNSKTGQITTGNVTRDNNVRLPDGRLGGQIYVLIPANNGNLIPALCYSTPINSLDNKDWYMQQAAEALVKCGESIADWGTNANALQKWLPIGDIHINFQYYDDIAKKAVDVDDLGKADRVSINYLDANGKRRYYILRLKNGVISKTDAIAAIRNIAKDNGLTTNIDKNKLTDTDYINHMSKYLYTNLMVGEQGLHTMNDWFTYEQTDIEKKEAAKAKTRKPTSTKNEPGRPLDPKPSTSTVTVNGTEYTMTAEGIVKVNDEIVTDPEIINRVKEALKTSIDKTTSIDLNASRENAFAALGVEKNKGSNLLNGVRVAGKGTGRLRGGASTRTMAATEERQLETMSSEALLNQAIEHCKQLFPALADEGRIVIVKGMINAIDTNGDPILAFGAFKDGILYLSDKAPIGTAYHEAFHYVTAFLLSDFEKKSMFKAAKNQWGNLSEIELEEKLAESFRAFMNGQERMDITQPDKSLLGRIKSLFRKLKDIFNGVLGRELYLDTLFYSIYRGRMANRTERTKAIELNMPLGGKSHGYNEKIGIYKNAHNAEDLLKLIAQNGDKETTRKLATAMLNIPNLKHIPITYDWRTRQNRAKDIGSANYLGIYKTLQNGIILEVPLTGESFETAALHEIVHAFTVRAYNTNKEFLRQIDELYNFMYKEFNKSGIVPANYYGTENPYEFMAEALADPKFINELRQIPYSGNRYPNIFEAFIDFLSEILIKFFNTTYSKHSLHDELVGLIEEYGKVIFNLDYKGAYPFSMSEHLYTTNTFKKDLLVHRANKVAYDNLSQEEKEYLALRKVSEKDYEALNTDQKEILLHCM